MDLLLIPFYIILLGIVVFPFLYIRFAIHTKTSETESEKLELLNQREIILENLRDIKIEFDTGKLTEIEFQTISSGIVKDLEDFDEKIAQNTPKQLQTQIPPSTLPKYCHECGFKIEIYGAKFCPSCGTKLII
ncbi:zinc ribbon domain-containing protein [Leptospira borgpetersenii]|uniref:zinc ribbon domain-containing protein n=1 Tax=Leptospira borgpetersenii TaxID=174 RepID=UPI000773402B|nr:zinc ribbon domain-containing protein [Leptospira borgpetersenii]MBE8400794.1 zinc ribbon domain-containing protein [Leptospira borgpetersenii serovar Tarassovi]MBE8403902.1 zinc ribbon domain-containing protein [Leptospira borgpetersenii serovar Tarassovi]MBE8406921.1 zinc ribbon domain-containing protein [Leptospira borgpetersenii serovar Tarassovi]MBE8413316.1 zinc ribbon domain-containing protein [Leptospira borgpetersenii serovar Tarassovi]MBE8416484.1 zinc ribbon domain-containing pro